MLIDCAVVGAGPAGLAASAALSARGVEHVVLEQGRVGESWRTQRWQSFRLNTPGWMNQLLGEQARDTYASGVEVVQRLEKLAADCPVREGVPVERLTPPATGTPCRPAGVTSWPAPSWSPLATRTCRGSLRLPAGSPTGLPSTTPPTTAVPTSSRRGGAGGRQRPVRLPDRRGPAGWRPAAGLGDQPRWSRALPAPRPREHRVAGRGRVHGPAAP
jgi:hypothetical protein